MIEPPQGRNLWITHFVIIALYVQLFVFVVGLVVMLVMLYFMLKDIILNINNDIWPLLTTVAHWYDLHFTRAWKKAKTHYHESRLDCQSFWSDY